jgi:hypothetical protein
MRATNWMMGLAAAAMLSALAGCGGPITYAIKGTPKSPELDGKVICEPLKDNWMTTIKVDLEHLAPPDRLGGGRHFIVWAKDEKGKWNRVGALKYDEKERKGTLEGGSTPATSFDMMITVEKDPSSEGPSGDMLYTQHVN